MNNRIEFVKNCCKKALPYNWEAIYDKAIQKVIDKNLLELHPSAFKGYISKMVKNLTIDIWRQRKVEVIPLDGMENYIAEANEKPSLGGDAITNLPIWKWIPPQDKELYTLYLEGYSNSQISDILGKTPNYWKGKIWRINHKIRKKWAAQ